MNTATLGAAAGGLLAVGVVLALAGMQRSEPPPTNQRSLRLPAAGWPRWRWAVAAAGGVAGWVVTGWPAAALIVVIAVLGLPPLLLTSREAARSIERVEAVEEWTRRLADILTVGVGLEQAVVTSVRTVPPQIEDEVGALAARLTARVPTEEALRLFADDLDDATGDLVVAALVLSQRRRGPGVARTLTAAADSVAEEVASRRRIEADRAKPRATARAVTLITLSVAALGMLNGTYVAPYGTPLGQVVLLAVTAAFVFCLWWMRSLTLSPPQPRLITRAGES